MIDVLKSILDVLSQLLGAVRGIWNPLGWLDSTWAALGKPAFDLLTGFLTSTRGPLSGEGLTSSSTVAHYAGMTRLVADAALAGVLVWAFIGVMWQQSAYGHYRLRMLLPRLLLASLLINFSLPLIQGAIDINRALSETVIQNGTFSLAAVARDISADVLTAGTAPTLIIAVGLFIGFVLLLAVYALRFALLTVLVITAPLAALLFVLHETSGHARQWTALFVTSLFMQPLQLLILGIGWSLDAQDLGLGPIRHVFALACLVICFRVPGVLHASSLVGRKALSQGHTEMTHAWRHLQKVHA